MRMKSPERGERRGRGDKEGPGGRRQSGGGSGGHSNRKKVCRVCTEQGLDVDYKNVRVMQQFVTERGKIVPRRISGNCARHQRDVTISVRRARLLSLIPFTSIHAVAAVS